MSSQTSENNKRIAKNTLLLYFRMLVTMGVSLYTSRIVLNTLGVDDYGLYNVVGGIIVILGFLNNAMAGATQRFLNVELGRNNVQRLRKVFCSSMVIHFLVAGVVILIAETIGLWYLNTFINVAPDRLTAANWVYQFSIASFVVNILSVPYNACIVAHEKMSAFAYISILEAFLKLVIVYLLAISPFDKLIFYAFLIFLTAVVLRVIYSVYCDKHFAECTLRNFAYDKALIKEMLSFSSWTIIGNLGFIAHTQGIALILNYFFSVTVNAASGIANQVNGVVKSFVQNFMVALNPQVVKTYAAGQYEEMHKLIIRGCQMAFYLVAFFAIPLTIEAPTILRLWLKIVPDYTVIFVRLVLLITLIDSYSGILATAKGATGNIKIYQITLTTIGLFHLPLAIVFFVMGFPPQYAMYVYLFIIAVLQVVRIWFVCRSISLSLTRFYTEVVARCLVVFAMGLVVPLIMHNCLPQSVVISFTTCIVSCISFTAIALQFGLNKGDRERILRIVKNKLKHQKKHVLK